MQGLTVEYRMMPSQKLGLVIASLYTANLAAFLTVRKLASPIESMRDLRGEKIAVKCASPPAKNFVQTYFESHYPDVVIECVRDC